MYPRNPVKTTLCFKFRSFSCHAHLMVILMVVVCGKASFSIHDTCPFRPLHCCTTPLPPFHVQVREALLGWEEGTCVPCVNFKCGSQLIHIFEYQAMLLFNRYLTHLVYASGHQFFRLLSCRCFKASSTLKGCTFLPCAFNLLQKKILISKQILVLSLLVFIQKDHVVIAVKDALSRYTPPVPEEYYKVHVTHSDVVN